jgi:hypothetical protein
MCRASISKMLFGLKDDNKMENVNNMPADSLASGPVLGEEGRRGRTISKTLKLIFCDSTTS